MIWTIDAESMPQGLDVPVHQVLSRLANFTVAMSAAIFDDQIIPWWLLCDRLDLWLIIVMNLCIICM